MKLGLMIKMLKMEKIFLTLEINLDLGCLKL